MRVKLTDICDIQYGYAFDSSMFSETEGTPLVRIRDVVRGFTETRTTESFPLEYAVHDGDILIGMDGEFNISRWHGGTAALNQRVCHLIPKDVDADYIFHFMPSALKAIEAKTPFVTVKHLSAKELNKITVPVPTPEKQIRIGTILNRILSIIDSRRRELANLDDLIKARFVEMFGDPVHNTSRLPVLPMTEVCEIIDGDRGKNYPKQEEFFDEEYCLFLNAKNVTSHGFDFSECLFITKEKDEALKKGKLKRGDVVLTTRGTLGNLAFYTNDVPYDNVRINSGMVILRMNKRIIDESFFIEQFKMQVDDIKKSIASGSAQPQLPISTMNKIGILTPDLSLQREFSNIVTQVDKSKFAVQKALDKAQLLFDSLMQQYFG